MSLFSTSPGASLAHAIIRRSTLFVLLLLIGAATWSIRTVGLRHGEPQWVFHPDVSKQTFYLRSAYLGKENPYKVYGEDYTRALYPYGTPVLMARLFRWRDTLGGTSNADSVHRYFWALRLRYFNVALFTGVLLMALLWLSPFFSKPALLITGALLAFEPITNQHNHFAMGDAPMAILMIMAWAAAWKLPDDHKYAYMPSLITGLSAGLAFGIKYQGITCLLVPGIIWLMLLKTRSWKSTVISAIAIAAGLAGGALASCPMLLHDPPHFLASFNKFMAWQTNITNDNLTVMQKLPRNLYMCGHLMLSEGGWALPPLVLWMAAFWPRRTRHRHATMALTALAMAFSLSLILLVTRDVVRTNDLIPIRIFMAAAFGACLTAPSTHTRPLSETSGWIIGTAAVLTWIVFAAQDSLAFSRRDTREIAKTWCQSHIPTHSIVLRESYVLPIDKSGVIEHSWRFWGSSAAQSFSKSQPYDYLLVSSLAHARFFDKGQFYYNTTLQELYTTLTNHHKIIAVFQDHSMDFYNPTITVYQREKQTPANSTLLQHPSPSTSEPAKGER